MRHIVISEEFEKALTIHFKRIQERELDGDLAKLSRAELIDEIFREVRLLLICSSK